MCRTKARFCGRASVCGLTHPKAATYNSQGIRLYMFLRTSKAALWRSLARLARISGPYQGTRAGPCPCGRAPVGAASPGPSVPAAAKTGQPNEVVWCPVCRFLVSRPLSGPGAEEFWNLAAWGARWERNQHKAALACIVRFKVTI